MPSQNGDIVIGAIDTTYLISKKCDTVGCEGFMISVDKDVLIQSAKQNAFNNPIKILGAKLHNAKRPPLAKGNLNLHICSSCNSRASIRDYKFPYVTVTYIDTYPDLNTITQADAAPYE